MRKYLLILGLLLLAPLCMAAEVNVDTLYGNWFGLREVSTPPAVTGTGKIYTKTDNLLYFQDGAGTESTVQLGGGATTLAQASIGDPAGVTGSTTYEALDLALTETVDEDGEWSVQSTDFYCYSGTETLTNVEITVSLSWGKTAESGTDVVTVAIGKDQQANLPIANGDEVGPELQRSFTNTTDKGIGAFTELVSSVATNDCIGLLWKTDAGTPTVEAFAGTIVIEKR